VSASDDLRLVSVHVVIRHGDRSPLHSLPNIVNKPFSCHLDPLLSNTSAGLMDFLRKMQLLGHRRSNAGSYAGYSLYPTEDICGSGNLTWTGVQQHIMNGAFLRQVYVTKHKLFVTDDDSFRDRVILKAFYRLLCCSYYPVFLTCRLTLIT